MDKGEFSPALGVPLKKFNGYLFKERTAIPLDLEELDVLIRASQHVWTEVEPAIFGTLLERALNPKERSKLGAHYTPRAYVDRLIGPTIMEPLRAEWDGVRSAAVGLVADPDNPETRGLPAAEWEDTAKKKARALVEAFHAKLAQTKVLDPACGTGNFLYVALARIKELEGEVIDLLIELGDDQYVAEMSGHTITPENFLGIEINPRAAAIAQLVLWIGYLQWHFRVNGMDHAPPEPILRDVRTIENRDALIDWDDKVLAVDGDGKPVSRWDGETMKVHPVTGKPVPDEAAQVEVYRYIKPRAAKWPKADYIIGNPPFIGLRNLRRRLDDQVIAAVREAYPEVPENVDWVLYWWFRAAELLKVNEVRSFGLVTTKSIGQSFARALVRPYLRGKQRISFVFAIPNHPWVDEVEGADVRISMVTMRQGKHCGNLARVACETSNVGGFLDVELEQAQGYINARLGLGEDVTDCPTLKATKGLSSVGFQIGHQHLYLNEAQAQFLRDSGEAALVRENRSTAHITQRRPTRFVIDAFGLSEQELRSRFPYCYQHISSGATSRAGLVEDASDRTWWQFQRPREDFRAAIHGLRRIVARPVTAKHHIFLMGDLDVVYDSSCVLFALDDFHHFAVLQSRVHELWFGETQGRMGVGDHPRYLKSDSFDPFPFPADVPEPLKDKIRAEAEALDGLRKRVLEAHEDLTLTKLYNVLEALKEGRPLTDVERDMHDRGLVTLIRQHHDTIDALVAEAYAWPVDLADEEILTRLVALNKARAAEEAKGIVRWLRPDFQAPDYAAPVAQMLDLGEGAVPLPDNVIPWPEKLPDQISAVAQVLAAARTPLAVQDVARSFRGKRPATVRPMLDALAGVGLARRLQDGRYAA
jgi:Fe2+ or Zn2+ uptake regulation protein